MASIIVLVLATAAVGAIGVGRIGAVRSDLQRGVDATAVAATELIRKHGLPLTPEMEAAAEAAGQFNVKNPVSFNWQVREQAERVEVEITATTELDISQKIFGGASTLSRRAVAEFTQQEIGSTERRRPKLVILLDYSGSMALPILGGSNQRAVDILEASVNGLLDANLEVDYAAALYNSGVFDVANFGSSAVAVLKDHMDFHDAAGGTAYSPPLNAARSMLQGQDDTGLYVLMVSDGQPGDAAGNISSAAAALWGMDVTIFSLEIRRQGSNPALAQNLINISGGPSNRGDPNYHFVAQSGQELVNQFTNIIAEIVCRAGPIDPPPEDPDDLQLILTKTGVADIELAQVEDVFEDPGLYGYSYDDGTQIVSMTDTACSAILDQGYRLVSRSDPGRLIE